MSLNELYRPQFHFSDKDGWINDPNGMIYYKGVYHLFYQNTPHDIEGDGNKMSWGHAISKDLIHFEILNPAILSTNEYAIWSGTCIHDKTNCSKLFDDENGGLIAYYTRKNNDNNKLQQEQCLAYSKDDGSTWIKYNNGKPIITFKDDPFNNRDFRDPKVLYVSKFNCYIMLVCGGKLRIYSSTNLIDWTLESVDASIDTECPDLFLLDVINSNEKYYVLSLGGRSYLIGYLIKINDKIHFVINRKHSFKEINFGPDSYATQSFNNSDEVISISWMNNWQYAHDSKRLTKSFAGAMTLAYKYSLIKENDEIKLISKPVDNYLSLNDENSKITKSIVINEKEKILDVANTFKLNLEFDVSDKQSFEIELNDNNDSKILISYDFTNQCLIVDRKNQKNSINYFFTTTYPCNVSPINNKISILMYVDRSSIELIINDGRNVGTFNTFMENKLNVSVSANKKCKLNYTYYNLNSIY